MLKRSKELKGLKLSARDGEIGKVKEFYFDDENWTVRYMVADTGGWLTGRQVLISPYALGTPQLDAGIIPVNLAKKEIEESPSIGTDAPVSRQFERTYFAYYNLPPYWGGPHLWGPSYYPYPVDARTIQQASESPIDREGDPHLRSTAEVSSYRIQARDGEIGHVEDFLIDDETWSIRYLVVDTRNWWPGKKVLVSPEWIDEVRWNEAKVFLHLSRTAIKDAPEYIEGMGITRDYETQMHRHYRLEGYWTRQPQGANAR